MGCKGQLRAFVTIVAQIMMVAMEGSVSTQFIRQFVDCSESMRVKTRRFMSDKNIRSHAC